MGCMVLVVISLWCGSVVLDPLVHVLRVPVVFVFLRSLLHPKHLPTFRF